MGQPVAKESDQVTAVDTHIVLVPSAGGPVATPLPHPFNGVIDNNLSPDVYAEWRLVALDGSTASNQPQHVPVAGSFQTPPSNRGTVRASSRTVFANDHPIARNQDAADTCNDPTDQPVGIVIAQGTVLAGD